MTTATKTKRVHDTPTFYFDNGNWVIDYEPSKQEGLAYRRLDMRKVRFSPLKELPPYVPAYVRKIAAQMIEGAK